MTFCRVLSSLVMFLAVSPRALPQTVAGPAPARPLRPVHTFSIVARDPVTGEMGAAVQSHWFAVGSDVIWAEAGVGAVATQSFIDPSYGPLGLASIRAGRTLSLCMPARSDRGNCSRAMTPTAPNGSIANSCLLWHFARPKSC